MKQIARRTFHWLVVASLVSFGGGCSQDTEVFTGERTERAVFVKGGEYRYAVKENLDAARRGELPFEKPERFGACTFLDPFVVPMRYYGKASCPGFLVKSDAGQRRIDIYCDGNDLVCNGFPPRFHLITAYYDEDGILSGFHEYPENGGDIFRAAAVNELGLPPS